MIDVQNLTKTFYVHEKEPGLIGSLRSLVKRKSIPREALRGVSFRVEAGEIVGLLGANGAGKTTLVKILSGIIYPSSGDAQVLGFRPWERRNAFRRQISLIMGQKAQLWWDLPATDCLLLLREIYRIPAPVYASQLDFLVKTLDVTHLMKTQIRRLSLGERMKMELIATLLHAPKIVFLDEPTIGLDLTAQRAIRKFLLEYRSSHNPAMLLTSHYMEDIEKLCKRIIVLRSGQIVYDGPLTGVRGPHADFRIVAARCAEPVTQEVEAIFRRMGELLPADSSVIRLKVRATEVAQAASEILARAQVVDLAIEEEDIATVIESMIRGQKV